MFIVHKKLSSQCIYKVKYYLSLKPVDEDGECADLSVKKFFEHQNHDGRMQT